ncbi:family 10 glycosylhydrolase [Aerosakkonemataceae cyanobacterium BLCC-F154]|uniref:Family 10 glycosylhydrolase n=1 Tax=Floridaenema fluviatile BLCC-F154 TaxID=3153640 RepID=A0ABV4YEJ6_9CYAN
MLKKRRWFPLLIALSMMVAVLIPSRSYSQTKLADIQGHWAQPCIKELVEKQIITADENGNFRPDSQVNRAEFATIISKAFPDKPVIRKPIRFADIPSNYWAANGIRQAYQTGFVSAYIGESFNPLRKLTREQVLLSLVKGLKYSPSQPVEKTLKTLFDDAPEIPKNSRNAIAAATEKLLIVNYPNVRQLKPNKIVTRAEVATFLCQALGNSQVIPEQYIARISSPSTTTTAVRNQTPQTTQTTEIKPNPAPSPTSQTTEIKPNPASSSTSQTTEIKPNPAPSSATTSRLSTSAEATSPAAVSIETPTSQTNINRTAETTRTTANVTNTPLNPIAVIRKPTPQTLERTTEIRGVWLTNIDSDVMFYRDKLSDAIANLKQLNFNTLYPTVWNWGYTLYPSEVAEPIVGSRQRLVTPTDENIDPELGIDRDVLQEVITQGHKQGMAVIPWFEFGFMAPADSQIAQLYPDWILKRQDGSQIWNEGPHQRVWMNPFHPEVQQFIESLILEIVTKYDIDGIQFDDHFGFPSQLGYDEYTVALYQQEHGGQPPPDDFQDPEWVRWRADKITQYMQRIHRAIKQRKPKIVISVSPNPQEFSYKYFLTDWQRWEEQGLIEELVLQVYRNDLNRFIAEIERPEVEAARRRIPVAIGIITGVKPQAVPMSQVIEQVEVARNWGFSGVSFFFYESLWNLTKEPPALRQSALQKIFPNQMPRPNIFVGWKPPR